MSEQYEITAVSETTRTYDDKIVYYVRLAGAVAETPNQAFELHQKTTTKPPTVGLKIDVKTFQKGDFNGAPYVKIVKDFGAAYSGGGGGGGGKSDDGTRDSIERQKAADIAMNGAVGVGGGQVGMPQVLANFEASFDVVLAKIQGVPLQLSLNGGEVPADTEGLQPAGAPAPDGDDLPF